MRSTDLRLKALFRSSHLYEDIFYQTEIIKSRYRNRSTDELVPKLFWTPFQKVIAKTCSVMHQLRNREVNKERLLISVNCFSLKNQILINETNAFLYVWYNYTIWNFADSLAQYSNITYYVRSRKGFCIQRKLQSPAIWPQMRLSWCNSTNRKASYYTKFYNQLPLPITTKVKVQTQRLF